jgi:hypothetical protein
MNKIAADFKDKGVLFYTVYTKEPHAGQSMRGFDFTDKKQTKTHEERINYAKLLIEEHSLQYPILIDTFGPECVQNTLGGGAPNSVIVVDGEGKAAYWQTWAEASGLRKKLKELTGNTK